MYYTEARCLTNPVDLLQDGNTESRSALDSVPLVDDPAIQARNRGGSDVSEPDLLLSAATHIEHERSRSNSVQRDPTHFSRYLSMSRLLLAGRLLTSPILPVIGQDGSNWRGRSQLYKLFSIPNFFKCSFVHLMSDMVGFRSGAR